MSRSRKQRRELIFGIYDYAHFIVALILVVVLVLDAFGVLADASWLISNLPSYTFAVVCLLVATSFLERRITLDNIQSQQNELSTRLKELAPPSIRLRDRQEFEAPLKGFLGSAEQVDILGFSLSPVVTTYRGYLGERANQGCRFRFLLVDPNSPAVDAGMGSVEDALHPRSTARKRAEIQSSISRLEPLLEMTNVELGFTSFALSFSLLIADPGAPYGKTQVELYGYGISPGDRPHFVLTPAHEPWYSFFTQQFERLRENARKYEIGKPTTTSRPDAV